MVSAGGCQVAVCRLPGLGLLFCSCPAGMEMGDVGSQTRLLSLPVYLSIPLCFPLMDFPLLDFANKEPSRQSYGFSSSHVWK